MIRVVVFIDGNNLFHRMRDCGLKTGIDVGEFARRIAGNRTLEAVYYYNVPPPEGSPNYWKQLGYYERVKKTPCLTFKLGWLKPIGDTWEEKAVDVQLAVDMVSLAYEDAYETAILVSCDGDFTPAVRAVRKQGKGVENIYFKKRGSMALRQACNVVRRFRLSFLKEYNSQG